MFSALLAFFLFGWAFLSDGIFVENRNTCDSISLKIMSDIPYDRSLGLVLEIACYRKSRVRSETFFFEKFSGAGIIVIPPSNFRTCVIQLLVSTRQSPHFRWTIKTTGTGGTFFIKGTGLFVVPCRALKSGFVTSQAVQPQNAPQWELLQLVRDL